MTGLAIAFSLSGCCQKEREKVNRVVQSIAGLFPPMPVGYPDGADTQESSWEHLTCVIPLEYAGLVRAVGENRATQAMHFWSTDHYRALYRTFLENRDRIFEAMKEADLSPPTTSTSSTTRVAHAR